MTHSHCGELVALLIMGFFLEFSIFMLFGSGLGHVACLDNGIPANFIQAKT